MGKWVVNKERSLLQCRTGSDLMEVSKMCRRYFRDNFPNECNIPNYASVSLDLNAWSYYKPKSCLIVLLANYMGGKSMTQSAFAAEVVFC